MYGSSFLPARCRKDRKQGGRRQLQERLAALRRMVELFLSLTKETEWRAQGWFDDPIYPSLIAGSELEFFTSDVVSWRSGLEQQQNSLITAHESCRVRLDDAQHAK